MKSTLFVAALLLGIVAVWAQASCPCAEEAERTCLAAARIGSISGQDICEERSVPCSCYCTYDGSATKTCLLTEGNAYAFTGEGIFCRNDPVLVPDCGGSPPIVTRTYLCANGVVTQGATSFDCVVQPLPCNENIIDAELTYYQYALYSANISFGPGTTQFQTDVTLINTPSEPTWFFGTLPGVQVLGSGIIDSEVGVTTVYREFEANASALTKPAEPAYFAVLNANCETQATTFTVSITFDNNNANANFDDASPRGVTATTGMSIVVTVEVN